MTGSFLPRMEALSLQVEFERSFAARAGGFLPLR